MRQLQKHCQYRLGEGTGQGGEGGGIRGGTRSPPPPPGSPPPHHHPASSSSAPPEALLLARSGPTSPAVSRRSHDDPAEQVDAHDGEDIVHHLGGRGRYAQCPPQRDPQSSTRPALDAAPSHGYCWPPPRTRNAGVPPAKYRLLAARLPQREGGRSHRDTLGAKGKDPGAKEGRLLQDRCGRKTGEKDPYSAWP